MIITLCMALGLLGVLVMPCSSEAHVPLVRLGHHHKVALHQNILVWKD